jgi:Type II secretion system (T2SS), protein G
MKGLLIILVLAAAIVLLVFTAKDKNGDDGQETYHQKMLTVLDQADQLAFDTKIKSIKRALNSYYVDHNEYPEILDMLTPNYAATSDAITDPWGTRFKLETDEEMNLILISAGKDRIFETNDDIKRRI